MVGGYAGKITGGTFFVDGNAVLAGPGDAPAHKQFPKKEEEAH